MYESHYGFNDLPFQISPDHRFFFPSSGHKKAMAYLTYGLHQRDGFIVITGHVGAGKTTIVRHLLAELDPDRFVSANIVTSQLGPEDTLRMVARAFGLNAENRDKAAILSDIEAYLLGRHREGKRTVLIVDEVQNMPFETIEELRMLSNFHVDNKPLIQCILLGQPEFREKLARPEMDQIRQRVIATCHLGPLDPDETRAYIEHRLNVVGWDGDPEITKRAHKLIYEMTDGVPRQINSLCGRLLLFGAMEEMHRIDKDLVYSVAEEIEEENGVELNGHAGANGHDAERGWVSSVFRKIF